MSTSCPNIKTPVPSPSLPFDPDIKLGLPDHVIILFLPQVNFGDVSLLTHCLLPPQVNFGDVSFLTHCLLPPQVNFGDVFIPAQLVPPRKRRLDKFSTLAHGVSYTH